MSTATSVSFKTKASSGEGEYELPPAGSHPAIMIGLVDLGTHDNTYNGKTAKRHKILLVWELTAESDSKGQAFIVAQDYTWSLNTKAQLRTIVEGFRAKALADDEEFDLMTMLGQPSMISLTEGVSGSGKKFVEVASVSRPSKHTTVPPASHETYVFHWGALASQKDDFELPDWMPRLYGRMVSDDLKASDEFAALVPF
jgi:hypothetical protein